MRPLVMGIVNVTPDSFSDGGRWATPPAAVDHGRRLIAEGADIVDVGGESTRPGAAPVDAATELARILPVVEALAPLVPVSIDTTKPEVARAAVAAGASIVNDVSASLHEVAGDLGVTWIAVHRQGTPATMQIDPTYDDVVAEVADTLVGFAAAGLAAGVPQVWVDPGIGFGKTTAHNLALLGALPRLVGLGHPVVVGASRKRFLGELLAASDGVEPELVGPDDRLEGSLTVATWAMTAGASVVRVHDVRSTVEAAKVVGAGRGARVHGLGRWSGDRPSQGVMR